jgi:hypothetical protein
MYKLAFVVVRLAVGISLLGSVAWQVTDRIANGLFRPYEYFAYFSIVSAIVAGLVLLVSAFYLATNRAETKFLNIARLSLAAAMVIVGVVYHALLADAANDVRDGDYAWPVLPNEIIHTYAPILAAIEYLISVPAFRIRLRAFLWVAVFPLTWLVLSVVRGSATNWWPYWFINPNGEAGLGGMLTYIGAITLFFLTVGIAVLGLKKLLQTLVLR